MPHLSKNVGFIPAWRNNDQIIIILVAQRALGSLLSPGPQAQSIVQLSAAGNCQPPWESCALAALWDILSLACLFCACHRDGGLQSQAEAPSFGDASHHESPADRESGPATTQPQGTWGVMESHQPFAANLSTKWWLLQVGMEKDLGAFLWQIPPPLCLAMPFPGSKGKSPVSSCMNKVRKYLLHPCSWFC